MDIEATIVSIAERKLRAQLPDATLERHVLEKAATETAEFLGHGGGKFDLDRVVSMLEERVPIAVGPATVLAVPSSDHIDWYHGDRRKNRRFFERYSDFLRNVEHWPEAAVQSMDDATDRIMEWMEDPQRQAPWDTRGLVVGHVQSGKTANYTGLIAKGADAGYRLIVVLAGMHNALRQQTQKRIDRDFLGYDTRAERQRQPIGVGLINAAVHADNITTQAPNGDFRRAVHDNLGMGVQERPVLLVVKKNASILRNLNAWVNEVVARRGDTETAPLLVIDDEADQASVDTGDQNQLTDDEFDPDYDPKTINGEIRRLLSAFPRSAYVAYTATPFANILIHDARLAEGFGDDLFPRNFIVSLQAPSNYVGPAALFGLNTEDPADSPQPLPVSRIVDQSQEGWLQPTHRKDAVPRFEGEERIPPSLEDAILSFILTCAARRARGQGVDHNSMLVHVSRFKDVHGRVHEQIDTWLTDIKRQIRYRTGGRHLFDRLRRLWEGDYVPSSQTVRETELGERLPNTAWAAVEAELDEAADRIRVQVVNSDLKEPIDYEGHKETGLSVIAVGGDKLSRGLTLEGLSVSYFLRATRMYDSLMQMGRWFGYRPGYLDLCRIYMPTGLQRWFRHVATAAEELRDRLDRMARLGARPKDYGLRVQSHNVLLVTARNKMRHSSEHQVSFAGDGKIQTVFFQDIDINRANGRSVNEFLLGLGPIPQSGFEVDRPGGQQTSGVGRRWLGVDGALVADLIGSLRFPEDTFDADRLRDYIRAQLTIGELTDWTIVLPSGRGSEQEFLGTRVATVTRRRLRLNDDTGTLSYRTILSPGDEALDLSAGEFAEALTQTNRLRAENGKQPTDRPAGPDIRIARGRRPERALLLLYPLDPLDQDGAHMPDLGMPLIGAVISFPDSINARSVTYKYNAVERRLELQ